MLPTADADPRIAMHKPGPMIQRAAPDTTSQHRSVGTVVAVLDEEVVVNVDGVLHRASTGHVARLRIGDWVMIGVGSVMGVVDGVRRGSR
jgi:hypothetical protein